MRATTIKVEGELLKELQKFKPPAQSLSGYVRSLLQQEVQRRKMANAADRYASFLRDHDDERVWLDEWDGADLARPPKRRTR
jgi:predicted CopG family antitoxin